MQTADTQLLPNLATRRFAASHRDDDVAELLLRGGAAADVDLRAAATQIEGWQHARTKLPLWAGTDGVVFPPRLSMEQCSSEETAAYKGRLVAACLADSAARRGEGTLRRSDGMVAVADLTGGFGVDSVMLSRSLGGAVRLTFVEREARLCALAGHNLPLLLPAAEVSVRCGACAGVLDSLPPQDVVYVDPARRDGHGLRTVALEDCQPDVAALQGRLLDVAPLVLLKLSPMLDLRALLRVLDHVSALHVVGLGGECKEVLAVLDRAAPRRNVDPVVTAVDVRHAARALSLRRSEEEGAACGFTSALCGYLYEPSAMVLKAGAFRTVAARFGLMKLHADSHLYTADCLLGADVFPGRRFRVTGVGRCDRRSAARLTDGRCCANLTVRGFPDSVSALRRRLRLGEGGDVYLFATTLADGERRLVRCERI